MNINKEESAGSSNQNEEVGRGCRNKKKQNDPVFCPVCSVTIRQSEIDVHLNSELEKLNKLPFSKYKINKCHHPSSSTNGSSENNADKNWDIFQKIRSNRQTRQKMKTRKRRSEDICPVCNKEISEDLTFHVELCLKRSEANSSESDENIDVEAFEEYEWAGQSRLRTTSLLQGDLSNLGTSISMADGDEDLNVDVDDTQLYGSPQYSETDVILTCEDPENVALRKAITGTDPKRLCVDKGNLQSEAKGCGDPTIEVLKKKIKELENRESNREEVYKCLICMERYRTPVTSICCWHVHCEECWLQTLGVKKLCPQCNMITSPADLRRIYM